ncbi:hypothetical protein CBM2585_B40005 [Cupriavidus taiwanensis]|nr:hypothetical protein CBM2585_A190003 [Cupriavidus taiwanensis]SOY70450.1 hypothetical protein CBM2585_B40005 [Cupriavidus taiwanensis]
MPYSKSSFDHLNTLVDTITTRYRVQLLCFSSKHRDTFTTSHIVKEQPIVRSLGNAKCKRSSLKRLHLAANQSYQVMVEDDGIEPTTPCLQSRCSPS